MVAVEGVGLGVLSVLDYLAPLANNIVRKGAVLSFGGGESFWVLSGFFVFIWDRVFLGMGRILFW